MALNLAERLKTARERQFVGRAAEMSLLNAAFTADELPFQVLHIFGPGGVGKTSLLHAFAHKHEALYLDARNIEPIPEAFLNALRLNWGLASDASPLQSLAARKQTQVILLDTYELLAPLDDWLLNVFLPDLPANTLIVLAGRHPPTAAWRASPGWQSLIRSWSLRNFSAEEGRHYLSQRGIAADQQQAIMDFTHGHPLALSLIAEAFAQRPGMKFQPETAPDVIKTLLELFVQKVPGPAHRAALEACALVRAMTESLLGVMLAMGSAGQSAEEGVHELFEWLRGLSFIEAGPQGLFPHDLAREALIADVRWRNPDWYAELHRRAREYYSARLKQGSPQEQQILLFDYTFLHRDNSVVRSAFEFQNTTALPDVLRAHDEPHLLAMVRQHEDEASAQIAAHWLKTQPQNVIVFRETKGQPVGFLMLVSLANADPATLKPDPVAQRAVAYLQRHAPLRAGEQATFFRFWMARDSYQDVSPVQSLVFINAVRHYLTTPGLAYTFFPAAQPELWAAVFAYVELIRLPDLDFACAGKTYGIYGHDWRVMPPMAWLSLLGEREIASDVAVAPKAAETLIVLSEEDFGAAVRDAFRDYARVDKLHDNPLLRSRLIIGKASGDERLAALQALIREASETLQRTPKDAKLYRALHHMYFNPAPSQELAAEFADVPFSTFRRHLKNGVERVTEILWRQEIGRSEK